MKKNTMRGAGAVAVCVLAFVLFGCAKEDTALHLSVTPFIDNENTRITCTKTEDNVYCLFLPTDADRTSLYVQYAGAKIQCNGETLPNKAETDRFAYADEFLLTRGDESYTLRVLQSENLPAVFIETDQALSWLHEDKSNKSSGWLTVSEKGKITADVPLIYLKGRGNSTWDRVATDGNAEKRPYNIKLEEEASLLGMAEAKKFRLLANAFDETLIRNTVALGLAKELGTYGALECRQIDLYINGDYRGNYLLTEAIEADSENIGIADTESLNKKANAPADLSSFPIRTEYDENGWVIKWRELPETPAQTDWAYILELDEKNEMEADLCRFFTDAHSCISLKNPENASEDQVKYVAELFNNAEHALYAEDGLSPDGKYYSELIDVDSAARAYLLQELVVNPLASHESQYYCVQETTGTIFTGPLWDFDLISCERDGGAWCMGSSLTGGVNWFSAAFSHADFRETAFEVWRAFRTTHPAGWISDFVNALAAENAASAAMDACRWPRESGRVFAETVSCQERCAALAQALSARSDMLTDGFSEKGAFIWFIYGDGKFCTQRELRLVGDVITVPTAEEAQQSLLAGRTVFRCHDEDLLCWCDTPDGGGKRYFPGDTMTLTQRATVLYAVWK